MKSGNRAKTADTFTVGSWSISPDSGALSSGNGDELYLEPRLAKLFCALSKNANKLVPRKQLIDQIWCDTVVNEESLTRAISDLRNVLNKHFDHPPRITTLPKRGYKLIIPLAPVKQPSWKIALKYLLYTLTAFVLLILIIRGLNY